MCESAKCKRGWGRGRAATPSWRSAPFLAASGNVVNHFPTLSHTHTHLHTHTHTFLWAATQRTFQLPAARPPPPIAAPLLRRVGGGNGRGKQFAAAAVFCFLLFSVILLCDPSVDFMYLFMGKLGKWLSLRFPTLSPSPSLSFALLVAAQGAKGYNYEVYTPFARTGLPLSLYLSLNSNFFFHSDFQLAFLPRPISRSPLSLTLSLSFVALWPPGVAYRPQLIRTSCLRSPSPPSESYSLSTP